MAALRSRAPLKGEERQQEMELCNGDEFSPQRLQLACMQT